MTYTYKITGMTCTSCVDKVKTKLENDPNITSAEISLEKNIAILTMDKFLTTEELQTLLGQSKYTIISTAKSQHTEQKQSVLSTYQPLFLIFLFITIITTITATENAQIELMQWMSNFMAGFFIVFSFFKFLDIKGFADSYAMYDVLAKKIKAYGFVYPFIELALGIAYLTNFEPKITYIATIVIMGFSSIGVIQSVLSKKKIRCACLGAVFNLPMSTLTIVEDLLMATMAGLMLLIT
jgi:copper chaperone CopZ